MFENITKFFKKIIKKENSATNSKDTAKERLHLVLMQDRANVSADFLDLMRQEIIDVIKKYIEVDENAIDVRLTNKENEDGTNGAPALYANIPIISIKEEAKKEEGKIAKEKKAEAAKKQDDSGKVSNTVTNDKEEKKTSETKNEKENKEKHEEVTLDNNQNISQEESKDNVISKVGKHEENKTEQEETIKVEKS